MGLKLEDEDLRLHDQRLAGRIAVVKLIEALCSSPRVERPSLLGGELVHFHLRRCDRFRRALLVSCLLPTRPPI